MRRHAKLSPSAAPRWMACPGSVALCATVPRKTSSYADEGTAAHSLAELCLVGKQDAREYLNWWAGQNQKRVSFLVKDKPADLTAYRVTDDMADAVQVYLDAVRDVGGDIQTEVKVDLNRWVPELFGWCDAVVLRDDTLHIFDYKHGAGVLVDPEENQQEMIYALGALDGIELSYIRTVRLVIVQPRHRSGGVLDWSIGAEDLRKWGHHQLVPAAAATKKEDAPLVPGDKQCRFCAAKAICPAILHKSLELAQVAFADVLSPTIDVSLPNPTDMNPEQLSRVLDFSELLSSWVSAVAAHAEQLALRGTVFPGRKIVRKTTHRAWKDETETIRALTPLFGDNLFVRNLKSPAQVEKLVKGKDAKSSLAPLWIQPEGDLTLVHESDRRAGVVQNILSAFYYDDL